MFFFLIFQFFNLAQQRNVEGEVHVYYESRDTKVPANATHVTISPLLTVIPQGAFLALNLCSALRTVIIPDSITEITTQINQDW